MRIVSGAAKGRRLAGAAHATRPTSDRAREGLFNTLAGLVDLDGARVVDLYAGTGAVGLEALSRGAASVLFVESDRRACEVLRRNVAAVGLPGATVRPRSVGGWLGEEPGEPFDLAFLDPPYDLDAAHLDDVVARVAQRLAPGAVVVVERRAATPGPTWPDTVTALQDRRYGEGVLWYGRRR